MLSNNVGNAIDQQAISKAKEWLGEIDTIKRLPAGGLSMIRTTGGKVFLVTDNGHFMVIGGTIIDVWNGHEVSSPEDIEKSNRVNIGKIGLDIADLGPFVIGQGQEIITLFLDPTSEPSNQMLSYLVSAQTEDLRKAYQFNIVLTPVLGQLAQERSVSIACDPDKNRAFKSWVKQDWNSLKPIENCDTTGLQRTLVTIKMLGLENVPYTILPSTLTFYGFIDDQMFRAELLKK